MATAFCGITNINLKINVKIIRESGTALSSAAGPYTVSLTKDFANLTSVQVTPNIPSGTIRKWVVDWDGSVVNPTGFDVYIYNDAGALVATDFSWDVSGVQGA